jgi:hypothetical protein
MADRANAPPGVALFKHRRPRWVRFAKAASKDLARDIYLTATKRGLDISFTLPSSGTRSGSGSASWSASLTPAADGSMTDVYSCLSGLLRRLELSEQIAGMVVMVTYGLLKGKDLELLPTTWRQQLQAALRLALLNLTHVEANQAAEMLRTLVEIWRPKWQQDYDAFCQRGSARSLIAAALSAAKELQRAPNYKDSEMEFDREVRAAEASDDELASI